MFPELIPNFDNLIYIHGIDSVGLSISSIDKKSFGLVQRVSWSWPKGLMVLFKGFYGRVFRGFHGLH